MIDMSRWIWLSVAAMFLVGASGCGRTATVKGKVTFQGRPVTHGSVILLSSDGKARSGVIESDGSYSVENVPAGDLKIGVISRNPSKGRTEKPGHEGKIDKDTIKKIRTSRASSARSVRVESITKSS
jgi:hypothetical protein